MSLSIAARAKQAASNRRNLRRRAGWAPGEHEKAEEAAKTVSKCASCQHGSPRSAKGWHADHDYRTGQFRGFLCHPCNLILGYSERHGLPLSPQLAVYVAGIR